MGPHRAPTQHLRMDPPLHRPPPASVSGMSKHKAKHSRPHVHRQQSLSDNGQLPSRPQSAQMLAVNSPGSFPLAFWVTSTAPRPLLLARQPPSLPRAGLCPYFPAERKRRGAEGWEGEGGRSIFTELGLFF